MISFDCITFLLGEYIMGGNAFNAKGFESKRMTKDEYERVEKEICDILSLLDIEYLTIPYVREKETFGDIDIVVVKKCDKNIKNILCENIDKFNLTSEFLIRNGDVISILYEEKYQIDLICTKEKDKNYHRNYLAYNDLGNLIGRTIKQFGYKHGHNGLFYVYREGNHYKEDILLTNDYFKALDILGLSIDKYNSGFDTFTDMFDYVTSSKYFDKTRFSLENLNNRNRVRDRKRKVYNDFIKYIENKPFDYEQAKSPFEMFDWLESKCLEIKEKRDKINALKSKINGNVIMRVLNNEIEGKNLGKFISFLSQTPNYNSFIMSMDDHQVEEFIKSKYLEYTNLLNTDSINT